MNAASVVTLDAPRLAALRAHLCATGNKFSASNIASQAIRAWLADHPGLCGDGSSDAGRFDAGHAGSATGAPAGGARGYQWKELFLPDGTELRMHDRVAAHARAMPCPIDKALDNARARSAALNFPSRHGLLVIDNFPGAAANAEITPGSARSTPQSSPPHTPHPPCA